MINALANHHILPHNGKGITKEMAVKALTGSINLDSFIASTFVLGAIQSNPDHHAHTFDLNMVDKHGLIEHDVSLSRDDIAFGDNHTFNKEIFETVMSTYGDSKETSFATASKARWDRLLASKKAHQDAGKPFIYGIKEFIFSYGETSLFTAVLGDKKAGTCPTDYLRIFFGKTFPTFDFRLVLGFKSTMISGRQWLLITNPEQERLPYSEGWRPATEKITQSDMNHLIFNLIQNNPGKSSEATEVGLGTIHAVQAAVTSMLPSFCTIM